MTNADRMKNLAERVLTFRAVNGISQDEFARRAGVSKRTISYLEKSPERMHMREITYRRIEYALMGGRR